MSLIPPTPSRFAVLPDDDTTDFKPKPEKKKAKKPAANDANNKGGKSAKGKAKGGSDSSDLKAAAFGTKSKGSKNKKNNKNTEKKDDQAFKEWKEKDNQIADQIYMGDLEKALLQSKVDYEATESKKQAATPDVTVVAPKTSKPVPISLEEFHALDEKKPRQEAVFIPKQKSAPPLGDNFFDGVAKDAQKVMNREIRLDELKRSCDAGPPSMATLTNGESSSTGGGDAPETSSSPNLKISLKLKDTEIAKLKRERDDAQAALEKVKEKNRMLVSILSQAETKEKAQILYKMEQLKAERTEFSSELTRMSTELEQERTRTRELAKELRKYQDKRKSSTKPE